MGVLQFQSLSMSFRLKLIVTCVKRFHFEFLPHEFRSRFSKQVLSVSIKERSRNICQVRESENRFITPKNLLMFSGKLVSIGKCVLIQPTLTWKHWDKFPCTSGCRILRWTGHQAFSFGVINLWSFRTCLSLWWIPWWCQQSTNLFVIEVRFRWRRDAFRWAIDWKQKRLVVGQRLDTTLEFSDLIVFGEVHVLLVVNNPVTWWFRRSATLKEPWIVAVFFRSLDRKKAEKECPCMSAAKYGTWHAEDEMFYVGQKNVLQSWATRVCDMTVHTGEQSVQRLCMRKFGVRKVYLSTHPVDC